MSEPTVSVIIPAYRAANTIARAVDSLLAQTRRPDEILIIDDGSPDNLAAAVAHYGDQVTLITKPNGGAATARNLGIERSTGEFITFLDADDYWEPDKLQRQLKVFIDHPEVVFAAGQYYEQPPNEARSLRKLEGDGRYLGKVSVTSGTEAFTLARLIWTTTVIVRRSTLGDQRFFSGLEPAEDLDLWIRLMADRPMYFDAEPLATWVLEPGSLSRSSLDVDCGNMLRVVRRNAELLGPQGLQTWEANTFKRWAGNHLAQGRPRAALKPAFSRLKRQPLALDGWYILLKSLAVASLSRPSRQQRDTIRG